MSTEAFIPMPGCPIHSYQKSRKNPRKKTTLVKLTLVPVQVFGAEDGYGLMDAVSAWSDCNRAIGQIYRVDDMKHRNPGEAVEIWVKKKDLPFFEKIWSKE